MQYNLNPDVVLNGTQGTHSANPGAPQYPNDGGTQENDAPQHENGPEGTASAPLASPYLVIDFSKAEVDHAQSGGTQRTGDTDEDEGSSGEFGILSIQGRILISTSPQHPGLQIPVAFQMNARGRQQQQQPETFSTTRITDPGERKTRRWRRISLLVMVL